ncbi:MAG: hypothetical protein Q9170_003904 [Blastenia crenularia]
MEEYDDGRVEERFVPIDEQVDDRQLDVRLQLLHCTPSDTASIDIARKEGKVPRTFCGFITIPSQDLVMWYVLQHCKGTDLID